MEQSTERTDVDANIELIAHAGRLIHTGFADRDGHPQRTRSASAAR